MRQGRLGSYRLLAELGSGGMGTVYRAEVVDPVPGLAVGAIVALKLVHPHLAHQPGYLQRFQREAAIGRRIEHPNVVRTLRAETAEVAQGKHHFLVMEFVEGQTLRALLGEMRRVPEALCRHIAREVAGALAVMHAQGVVHRDLKPENVLITKDDRVKVMDLGVARVEDATVGLSQTGAFLGSLEYAAPEQLRGVAGEVDGRIDLHALGLVLYELATALHPYRADTPAAVMRRILEDEPRRLGEIDPQLSAFFEHVVHLLLEKDPARRPATASELIDALDGGESGPWWKAQARALRSRTARPLRRVRIPRETALHGREKELGALGRLYEEARAGRGRVVLLEGEPGVGKTRLVDEFVARLWDRGEAPHFLHGAYPIGGGGLHDGALCSAYRDHLGEEGLAEGLRRRLPDTPDLVSPFARLLRGDVSARAEETLSGDALKTLFVRVTHALAEERPTVVLVDDLHRASEEGRALFSALAHGVQDRRVLLIGCFERGALAGWQADLARLEHVRPLPLRRLGAEALVGLLLETTGSDRLAHDLAERIADKTDGNPFFVFELLRMLREEGNLSRTPDGKWTLSGTPTEIGVPSSVLGLVRARVAHLPSEERDLLDVAACLGVEFDPVLAGRVLELDALTALRRFARIERQHRLVRSAGRNMVFDHPSVRDALYQGLSVPLREQYHALIAELLSAATADASPGDGKGAPERVEEIFEHAIRGGRRDLALRHMDEALRRLKRAHMRSKAFDLAEACLEEPGLLDVTQRIRLLLDMQRQAGHLGRSERQGEMVEEAVTLAREVGDERQLVDACIARGLHLYGRGRFEPARGEMERTVERARRAGLEDEAALVRGHLGLVLHAMGQYDDAEAHLEAYLEHARRQGNLAGEAGTLTNLGLVASARGDYEKARRLFEKSYELAVQSGDRTWQANAASNLGGVYFVQGRWDEARRQVALNLQISRKIGHRRGEAVSQGSLGVLAEARGRLGEALAHQQDAVALFHEIGDPSGEALALGNLGHLQRSLGRLTDALATYDRQLDLARRAGDPRNEALATLHSGITRIWMGDATEGEARLVRALERFREQGRRRDVAYTLLALGRNLVGTGPSQAGGDRLREAVAVAADLGMRNIDAIGSLLLALHGEADARDAVTRAEAEIDRLERDDALEVRFLQHRVTGEPAYLEQADSILRELRAHAPPADRDAMLHRVPLYREITAARGRAREPDPT